MMRWMILAVLVVVLSGVATVAVTYLPEITASSPTGTAPVGLGTLNKPQGPQPKAVVETPFTYEFGTLAQRVTGKHKWKVENTGKGTLELWMVSSTCSCTLAKFKNGEKASVAPGENTEIELEFETRENNGDYTKGATIGTSDPDLPSFDLRVSGKVYPAVMTMPPDGVLNYTNISNDKDDHIMQAAIYSKDRPETKVIKFKTSNEKEVDVKYEPLSAEDCKALDVEKGMKVFVNIKGGLPLGNFREEVILTTDHPKQPEVRLVVSGQMSGPINLIPGKLNMHQINSRMGASGGLMISVRNSRETKFEVAHTPKGIQAEVVPVANSGKKGLYRLVVTVPPNTPPQNIEDEILLKTDHPKAVELIVPMSLWIQDGGVQ